jgi:transposase
MIHSAVDLHQKSCRLWAEDDVTGEVLLDAQVPSERQALLDCLRALRQRGNLRIVLEACGFAGYWSDVLQEVGEVVAVHPKHVAAIRGCRRKNDRRDAQFLATLSRVERLPVSYLGTTQERDLKDLLRYRVGLVRLQTRLRVKLRNVAQRYGTVIDATQVESPKARRQWKALSLRPVHRLIVEQLLELLAALQGRLSVVEKQINERAVLDWRVRILDTLPGLDLFGALLVSAEIGPVERFQSGSALACYAGLVPSEQSSGERQRRGRITKEGSTYLRWVMIQAALHHNKSARLHRLYERVLHRSSAMKARVAVAREMLFIAYWMLRNRTPYEERVPRNSSGKAVPPLTQVSTSSG